jgi:preprotein translocase subunit YajC
LAELASLLPIVGIFLVFWLLIIRPASRRQKQMQSVQRNLNVGDHVITSSGFFGDIATLDDDKVGLRIAEGVVVTVARQAIVGVPDADAQSRPAPGDRSDEGHDPEPGQ